MAFGAPTTSGGYPGAPPPADPSPEGKKLGDGHTYPGAGAPPPFMMPPMMPISGMMQQADPESQAMQDDMSFASVKVRNGFVRKVFALVALQLLVTAAVAAVCIFVPEVKLKIRQNPWM